MTEAQILRDIRAALGREPDLVLWRLSQGGAVSRAGQTYRAGLSVNGASDLLGILAPTGRLVALEVKAARGRVSPDQQMFLDLVRRMGGFAAVVRSVDDARSAISRARTGDSE